MESSNHGIAVSVTILLAVILSLMPLSGDWIVWKPNFLLLVMLAWVLRWPDEFGVFFSAAVGLLADIILRTAIGHSILIFALCGSIVILVGRWTKYLSPLQRMLMVAMILGLTGLLEAGVYMLYGRPSGIEQLPMKMVLSMLAWPIIERLVIRFAPRRG